MSRVRTDLALRRLIDSLKLSQTSAISSAATSMSKEMETTASGVVVDHANTRQFIHGTGPYYLAKTSRGDQWPSWKDLKDIPADLQETDFDPENIEIDASQITTGTLALARLAIATSGENSATKLVRADDVRLGGSTGQTFSAPVGVALESGDYVTAYNDSGTTKLMPASSSGYTTRPIGHVLSSYAIGATGVVYPTGVNDQAFIELTPADIPAQVFLMMNGKVSTNPAGMPFVMPVGIAQAYISATRASIQTRYEMVMEILPDPMLAAIRDNEADYAWYAGAGWSTTRWTDVMRGVVATSASPPTWSATGIGGKPAAVFNGTTQGLQASFSSFSQPFAVVSVFSADVVPFAVSRVVFDSYTSPQCALYGSTSSSSILLYAGSSNPNRIISQNTAICAISLFNGAASSLTVNGNTSSGNPGVNGLTNGMGIGRNPAGGQLWDGPIALITIVSGPGYADRAAAIAAAAQSWYGVS